MSNFSRTGLRALWAAAASAFLWGCASVEKPPAPVALEPTPSSPEFPQLEDLESPVRAAAEPQEVVDKDQERSLRRARSLAGQAEPFGLQVERVAEQRWEVSGPKGKLALFEDSRRAELNGRTVYLDQPFAKRKGRWSLSDSDARLLLPAAAGAFAKPSAPVRVIAIDPGHGGSEEGAKNLPLSVMEKELNLDVALRLDAHLQERGFRTVLTRYDDRLVKLEDRPDIANRGKADLFVSIHFNASPNKDAIGLETYMLTPPGEVSTADETAGPGPLEWPGNARDELNFSFAYAMQGALVDRMQRKDRGLRKARFAVLKNLACPGVLVECGFISNEEEALLLRTPFYREKLAQTLAQAIAEFAAAAGPEPSS